MQGAGCEVERPQCQNLILLDKCDHRSDGSQDERGTEMRHYKAILIHGGIVCLFTICAAVNFGAQVPTPCDSLPQSGTRTEWVVVLGKVEDSYCNANCTGGGPPVPVRSGWNIPPPAGGVLKYIDQWHGQCEQKRSNEQGTGFCKHDTVCPPGATRVNVDGVWKCRYPETRVPKQVNFNPRDECMRNLPISIQSVRNPREGGAARVTRGFAGLFVVSGPNVAMADRVAGNGGFEVEFARRLSQRLQPSPTDASYTCPPPNCVVLHIDTTAQTLLGSRRITLSLPGGYKSASFDFTVVEAIAPVGKQPPSRSSPAPVGRTNPPPPPPRRVNAIASVPCPASDSRGLPIPSEEFEVRGSRVQATATAIYLRSREIDGKAKCIWDDPYRWFIRSIDGRNQDVTISFNPLSANTVSQTVTLLQGRWQIVPDRTFPVDYQYVVQFEEP
jgi:hypothetical protein